MKRNWITALLPMLLVAALLMTAASASYQSKDVTIGTSNEVQMVGDVQATIMSVTMPTYVPFEIGRSIAGDNKVVSPRILVKNNSGVPVSIDVVYTRVDLSNLRGTTWNDSGNVGENQIAIGFQIESTLNQLPTSLSNTRWLIANATQNATLMSLGSYGESAMYVVGTLGSAVPDSNTFTVTPTLVARQVS